MNFKKIILTINILVGIVLIPSLLGFGIYMVSDKAVSDPLVLWIICFIWGLFLIGSLTGLVKVCKIGHKIFKSLSKESL